MFYQNEAASALKQVSAGLCLLSCGHSKERRPWPWPWLLISISARPAGWEGIPLAGVMGQRSVRQPHWAPSQTRCDGQQVTETFSASVSLGCEDTSFSLNIRVSDAIRMGSVPSDYVVCLVPHLSILYVFLLQSSVSAFFYFMFAILYNNATQWCLFVHLFLSS